MEQLVKKPNSTNGTQWNPRKPLEPNGTQCNPKKANRYVSRFSEVTNEGSIKEV